MKEFTVWDKSNDCGGILNAGDKQADQGGRRQEQEGADVVRTLPPEPLQDMRNPGDVCPIQPVDDVSEGSFVLGLEGDGFEKGGGHDAGR